MKEDLFFTIGPCTVARDESRPIPPSNSNFLLLPSFIEISNTEDNLPPY